MIRVGTEGYRRRGRGREHQERQDVVLTRVSRGCLTEIQLE